MQKIGPNILGVYLTRISESSEHWLQYAENQPQYFGSLLDKNQWKFGTSATIRTKSALITGGGGILTKSLENQLQYILNRPQYLGGLVWSQ